MEEHNPGNVVKDFFLGKTHVKICDDYCRDKTEADVEAILRRIAQSAIGHIRETVKEAG